MIRSIHRPKDDQILVANNQGVDGAMVETDAPYLAPDPHRGKECEPAMVRHTAEKCAELLGITPEDFAMQSTRNAEAFFNLPDR